MRFTGKNVIVTGAAMGVGRVIATSFAAEGADVAIIDFADAFDTKSLIEKNGRRCETFKADIRHQDQVDAAVGGAARFFGDRIDVLINNAGFNGHYSLVKDIPLEHWRETLDINLTGTMLVTQAVMPYMIARRTGAIGTTASNVARRGLRYRADYVCAKWAILGLTQTLALELAEHNVRCNAVCPGPIEGDRIEEVMSRQAAIEGKSIPQMRKEWEDASPMKRFVTPEEVTAALMFLTSDAASGMTGQALNVTAGFLMT
jgi:NAD(P)-dependent dehydrogenase (short-subunit alcohol dehydrogenase family)